MAISLALKTKNDVILYDGQYSMIGHYINDVVVKELSLFNTQPNRPRASPAIFKHVGQVRYSRGFKFGEKGPIKILAHFCLQVRRC